MASLVNRPGGRKWICFFGVDKKRRTLRLGKTSVEVATRIKVKVESLVRSAMLGEPLEGATSTWLAERDEDFYEKLVAVGLVEPRRRTDALTAAELCREYIERRSDIKNRTLLNYKAAERNFVEFFGADRYVHTITPGEASDWRRWLEAKYATATWSKIVKMMKMFIEDAIDRECLDSNPLRKIKSPKQANDERMVYVSPEVINELMKHCPHQEWRTILALTRFAGLRCPSEVLRLTWGDIDWDRKRMTVHASKTEHHRNGGVRIVPLFPEVEKELSALYATAPEGSVHVISRYRGANTNLRTQLNRICERAKIDCWPKTFQNLRSSCQTDLAGRFPLHVVVNWIGNSEVIAKDHYLQTTEDHFAAATDSAAAGKKMAKKEKKSAR